MSDYKEFLLTTPAFGTRKNTPSMLLDELFTSDGRNMLFRNHEWYRVQKRKEEFPDMEALPDTVMRQDYYYKAATSTGYFMALTTRDIAYRDESNNCWIFLNKDYTQGQITVATPLTGERIQLTIAGTGVDLSSNVQVGDFIQITDDISKSSNLTWYEVLVVLTGNQIIVKGVIPTGWAVGGGHDYLIRMQYNMTNADLWSTMTISDRWFATNGVDQIQHWDGVADETTDLTECPYLAKRLYKFRGRPIIGNLTRRDSGLAMPFAYGWGGIDNYQDWGDTAPLSPNYKGSWNDETAYVVDDIVKDGNQGWYWVCNQNNTGEITSNTAYWVLHAEASDAGIYHVDEGIGVLTGFSDYLGFLYIFKEQCVVEAWDVGGYLVFNKILRIPEIGTNSPDSIVYTPKGIAFLANDNTYRLFNGLNRLR